ncbi:hypothetical protein [Saccharothrix sp. ST-888]|uniref:hypothetical protein n=1 Tax=Saccharothrix sp. ST-888 TaxID=1427391 RepID=UPI0005EC265B|nr:hypothetical protein [Saccharothrix sp. ST-888]KJK56585.1 hypothetical protein UK12_21655 [Saccharothrix sp. ST-888]
MHQLTPPLGGSSSTVCDAVREPGPGAGADGPWTVDGTLLPVRDCSVCASNRNYRVLRITT